MLLFEVFKELTGSLFRGVGSAWRRGGRIVQGAVALGVLVLVAFFVAKQWQHSFVEQAPEWLRPQKLDSPPLAESTWKEYRQLLTQAQSYSDQWQVPIGSVRLLEVRQGFTNAVIWNSETFVNQGFDPQRSYERSFGIARSRFIGYYSGEGQPLEVTIKHSPSRPRELLLTVHLDKPVPPGATETIFRLETQPGRVGTKDGKQRQLSLGRLPDPNRSIHISGISLPEGCGLVRFAPEKGASVATNGGVLVSWVNARVGTSAPPLSLVFTAAD